MDISIKRAPSSRLDENLDLSQLAFGSVFTDHMFVAQWSEARGWYSAEITPYANLPLAPATVTLHYAQSVFEGMKAFRQSSSVLNLFRPDDNYQRFIHSARRMALPDLPAELFVPAIKKLVEIDHRWVPHDAAESLYIRPFMFGSEKFLGLRPSKEAIFCIIMSPVKRYGAAHRSQNIMVSVDEHRAFPGGIGSSKASANYAASLYTTKKASEQGYDQVLWLDGLHKKWIEEVGTMNILFVIDGIVISPKPSDTVLDGITRQSVLTILRDNGYKVEERPISIDEVVESCDSGRLSEAFGAGTAAAISPVGRLGYKDRALVIGKTEFGPVSKFLYDEMNAIYYGKKPDPHGWIKQVKITG